jgi:hypothetical protein
MKFAKKMIITIIIFISIFPSVLSLSESTKIINANKLWNYGYDGSNIKVCVIDSGITNHEYLKNRIKDEKCFCSFENCCSEGQDVALDDDDGHGTIVAGIISSTDPSFKGVSYNVDLYIAKAANSDGDYKDDLSDVSKALIWCRDEINADIISMSFGDKNEFNSYSECENKNDDLTKEIKLAYDNGITLVASAGNEWSKSGISYPACLPFVISVGATYDVALNKYKVNPKDKNWLNIFKQEIGITANVDDIAFFSNRGDLLDVLAPGFLITSLNAQFFYDSKGTYMGYKTDYGTSEAAPHVTGAAALLQDVYNGKLTPEQIRTALIDSGKYGGVMVKSHEKYVGILYDGLSFVPVYEEVSYPRIDVFKAFEYLPILDALDNEWKTYRHDNLRTGFTPLKGDFEPDSMVRLGSVLLGETDNHAFVRPSVADIVGDEKSEVITAYTNGEKAFLSVLENNNHEYKIELDSYTSLPPTIGDVNGDGQNDIIVSTQTTLSIFTIENNQLVKKLSLDAKNNNCSEVGYQFQGYFGGTAISDIDNNGINNIISADETYLNCDAFLYNFEIDEDWNIIKQQTTSIGNVGVDLGSAVAIANLDSDTKQEVVVPTVYGSYNSDMTIINNKYLKNFKVKL